MKRLLFFVAFMTAGTFALIELLVTKPTGPARPARRPAQAAHVLHMHQVVIDQMIGEHTRWELHAALAVYDENTDQGDLQQVHFKIYRTGPGMEHEVAMTGRSDQALLSRNPDDVVLIGSVVLTQGDQLEIRSNRIEYDGVRQLITSPVPTQVRSPQGDEQGDSLRYSIPDQTLHLTNPLFMQ